MTTAFPKARERLKRHFCLSRFNEKLLYVCDRKKLHYSLVCLSDTRMAFATHTQGGLEDGDRRCETLGDSLDRLRTLRRLRFVGENGDDRASSPVGGRAITRF